MKKIFTLLVSLGALSTAFAQHDFHQQNQPANNRNNVSQNSSYTQKVYDNGNNTAVYSENNQQQQDRNYGYQNRENAVPDYARNNRRSIYDNDGRYPNYDRRFENERNHDYDRWNERFFRHREEERRYRMERNW